ncbi:hypothetical protein EVAR_66113_1 [Eumeta japonica]|uniref:Uncharacterized protein n=1 Tax=Eumeta variegata TaxID=151549 RepID=A0A4C2A574_EUMVA|nr:hypothetical protein EVAR_66113_1 [Eumeta japonica]
MARSRVRRAHELASAGAIGVSRSRLTMSKELVFFLIQVADNGPSARPVPAPPRGRLTNSFPGRGPAGRRMQNAGPRGGLIARRDERASDRRRDGRDPRLARDGNAFPICGQF